MEATASRPRAIVARASSHRRDTGTEAETQYENVPIAIDGKGLQQ